MRNSWSLQKDYAFTRDSEINHGRLAAALCYLRPLDDGIRKCVPVGKKSEAGIKKGATFCIAPPLSFFVAAYEGASKAMIHWFTGLSKIEVSST